MLKNSSKTKNILSNALTCIAVILGLILIMSIFMGIPYILKNLDNINKIITSIGIFLIGLSYLIMIFILLKIVNSARINVFVKDNTKRFRQIGYILFINLALEYMGMLLSIVKGMRLIDLFPGVFITPGMAIYFITGLLCFVIGDTINEAKKLKNENDLTI